MLCIYCSRSLKPACFHLIYLFRWYINRYSAQINDVPIPTWLHILYYQLVLWVLFKTMLIISILYIMIGIMYFFFTLLIVALEFFSLFQKNKVNVGSTGTDIPIICLNCLHNTCRYFVMSIILIVVAILSVYTSSGKISILRNTFFWSRFHDVGTYTAILYKYLGTPDTYKWIIGYVNIKLEFNKFVRC